MTKIDINIDVLSDSDAFVSLQCPFCKEKFKLRTQDLQSDDLNNIFCPYCGLTDEVDQFITDEVKEQMRIIAQNHIKSILNNSFKKLKRKSNNNTKLSLRLKKSFKMEDEKILCEIDDLEIVQLKSCNSAVKVDSLAKQSSIYCPFCGFVE